MPGLDGTGPRGMGPMTGGSRGWCNPASPMFGRGYGPYAGGFGYPGMQMPYGMGMAYGAGPMHGYPMGYGRPYGFGRGMGPCGGGMAWGRGRGMGRGRGW